MEIKLKSIKIKIDSIVAHNLLKFQGLMFRSRETAPVILFNVKGKPSLHSLFVFFPFLVLWLDEKNNVLEYRVISSVKFNVNSKSNFTKILEIPINQKYHSLVKSIVGKTFKKKN